jgi:DNA helicase-2/ATP-dependent DNA helicase PcrA
VREKYQNKFEYILVDEYQDVNVAQYRLIALLGAKHKNITVVGDDDQSIYSWRGSDYRMILRFEEDFPGAKVFKLEENYRSTQRILDAANALVENNKTRAPKKLFTSASRGRADYGLPAATERDEARYVRPRKSSRWSATARPTRLLRSLPHQRAIARFRRSAASPTESPTAWSAASASTRAPRSRTSSRTCATS